MNNSENMTKEEAKQLKELLSKFVKSYSIKDPSENDEVWLKKQFQEELPNLNENEAEELAKETVQTIVEYDDNLKSINDSIKAGISKERWFADKVSKAATGVAIIKHGEYLKSVNDALTTANSQMLDTCITKAGEVNQSFNLDGYIAEQMHVNTFNARAALENSKYYAKVLKPESGSAYTLNSVDIGIYDSTSKTATPVHRYQVKYGADAKATIQMLRDQGDVTRYGNQQIVVPPEQVAEVQAAFPGKTVVSQIGGTDKVSVRSNPLSKAEAKELQLKTQEETIFAKTDWNVFKTKELALQVGKNAGLAGMQAAAITGGFMLAKQIICEDGVDVEETVGIALKTGVDAGLKTAITGAIKVGVERGIVRVLPPNTPIGVLANIVCITIENVKILGKLTNGELTVGEALEQMGRNSTAMIYGLGWGAVGSKIGALAFSWIPVVGPFVGGVVGGMVGYMAGSTFGETVFEGVKKIANGASKVVKSAMESIGNFASKFKTAIFG